MQSFEEAILKVGKFSRDETRRILSLMMVRTIESGEYCLRAGEVCSSFSFLQKGAMKDYYINKEGEEVITNLFAAPDWILNRVSFTTQKAANSSIQAVETCEVVSLSIDKIHHLISESQVYFQLGRILDLLANFQVHDLTPEEKYLWVMEQKPEWLQKFPLKHIASYLKITPETLSRVRKRMSQ